MVVGDEKNSTKYLVINQVGTKKRLAKLIASLNKGYIGSTYISKLYLSFKYDEKALFCGKTFGKSIEATLYKAVAD